MRRSFITLMLVPCLYFILEDLKARARQLVGREAELPESDPEAA